MRIVSLDSEVTFSSHFAVTCEDSWELADGICFGRAPILSQVSWEKGSAQAPHLLRYRGTSTACSGISSSVCAFNPP